MNLNEIKELIKSKSTKGIVRAEGYIKNRKDIESRFIAVEIFDRGFVTAYDDKQSNIQIDENIVEGTKVEVNIIDGMIVWSSMRGDNLDYYIPYCVDESQIVKPIIDIPEIRVYSYGGTHMKFSCFKLAWKYYTDCKDTSNLQTPVVAFDHIEINLWDIRRE